MQIIRFVAVVHLCTTAILFSLEIPLDIVNGLKADEFAVREKSQEDLLNWAEDGGNLAVQALSSVASESEEPEVAHRARAILRELSDRDYEIEGGNGYLGISLGEIELPRDGDEGAHFGVLITRVIELSPAEKSGFLAGDIITEINGEGWNIKGAANDLRVKVGEMAPKTEVRFLIIRGEEEKELKAVLGKRPIGGLGWLDTLEKDEQNEKDEHFAKWLKKHGLEEIP